MKLAVLLTYYGNGCGQEGGGAAAQIGMSRTCAGRFIRQIERILFKMMPDVVSFPLPDDVNEWEAMVAGFERQGSDFPRVACVFDGTIIKTKRPNDHQGFYDKNGNPSYNCLACIDHRDRFRYFGVFSGSNSDQSMWNQSMVLGTRARYLCPAGINWLGGFKLWPFLMVPFDSRGGKTLTRKHRCFNYHLSSTRILVECVLGKLKGRLKVLHGVTDRRTHWRNARMISCAVVLHNILIDIGDEEVFQFTSDKNARIEARIQARRVMRRFDDNWDQTQQEINLANEKRNA